MTNYTYCPECASQQVVLSGKITRHQAKRGARWSTCPGSDSAVSKSDAKLTSTASITGQKIYQTGDVFHTVCPCGAQSVDFPTALDAQRAAREHWTTKPYCTK